jgi:hypothetical protein
MSLDTCLLILLSHDHSQSAAREVRTYRCDTSLRTTAKTQLQLVRDRWSIKNSWHRPRDAQLKEDTNRYSENIGVRILVMLLRLAMNALLLGDAWSLTGDLAALTHDIRGLVAHLADENETRHSALLTSDERSAPFRCNGLALFRKPCLTLPPTFSIFT